MFLAFLFSVFFSSVALVGVHLKEGMSLVVSSSDSLKCRNNVSIVVFSSLYFFSIILAYQCLYCSNFVLCNLVFYSFNPHQF